jgi:uncharacterized membrane protein
MAGFVHDLEQSTALDPATRVLADVRAAMPSDLQSELGGRRLGHPLHPMLTDLPIGFWTSGWVLDLVGGKRRASAAQTLVGLGVLTAVPTAASGLVDWGELTPGKRRAAVVHLAANTTATGLYAMSYLARRRGERGRGIWLGLLASGAATLGGYLGGHLAYGHDSTEDGAQERPSDRRDDQPELFDGVPGAGAAVPRSA